MSPAVSEDYESWSIDKTPAQQVVAFELFDTLKGDRLETALEALGECVGAH